jgi:hypothetical protein
MVLEEGRDLDQMQVDSIFTTSQLASDSGRLAISKLLDDFSPAEQEREQPASLIPARIAAFGIQ